MIMKLEDETNDMKNSKGRVPYQFYVDKDIKDAALNMKGPTGIDLSTFMRMAMEQFVERPLSESMDMLIEHAKRHKVHRGRK